MSGSALLSFEPAELENLSVYKLMTGIMVPRPIAFVSTVSKSGVHNLAPFSWNTAVSLDPLIIGFTPVRLPARVAGKEDTYRNIEEIGDFVYNIVLQDYAQPMVDTSANWVPEVDEFEKAGLRAVPSTVVTSPRVAESPVSLECELLRIMEFGGGETAVIFGKVVGINALDEYVVDGRLDLREAPRVGRLAGVQYADIKDVFRPEAVSKEQEAVTDYLFE